MADRHRHRPISFRPPSYDRKWLERYATETATPLRRILSEALSVYRQAVSEPYISYRDMEAMMARALVGTGPGWDHYRRDVRALIQELCRLRGEAAPVMTVAADVEIGTITGQERGRVDELLADPAANPLGARWEDARSSAWDQLGPVNAGNDKEGEPPR